MRYLCVTLTVTLSPCSSSVKSSIASSTRFRVLVLALRHLATMVAHVRSHILHRQAVSASARSSTAGSALHRLQETWGHARNTSCSARAGKTGLPAGVLFSRLAQVGSESIQGFIHSCRV